MGEASIGESGVTGPRVLVVDDEESIVDLVGSYLRNDGFQVDIAMTGPEALAKARAFRPDLVVLDLNLPGVDGLEVLRQLRAESAIYVILLTARTEETDRIVGLSVGADDYVTKPFSPRELVARVRAVLRRSRAPDDQQPPLTFRRVRVDPGRREVTKDGQPVTLTALEFDLLYALARDSGHVLTRESLLQRVWGADYFGDARVVDAHVKELRRKLGDDPNRPVFIHTVRGVGYKFADAGT
jgi:two-component system alkaline phosphatase synthesis response regulator PhoP